MKKISFWIVIFICMADAALAVTQEGGLFYLPEDTTMQHKDSTVQKRTFFKRFLDYFNDANKDKNHKKFDFSIIGGPHYSTDTKLGLGLVARVTPKVALFVSADYSSDVDDNDLNGLIGNLGVRVRW